MARWEMFHPVPCRFHAGIKCSMSVSRHNNAPVQFRGRKLQNSCLSRIALMAGTKLLLGHAFSIQGQRGTYLLIVTMSACIGCKAVLVVSLLVGLLAALAGEAFLSAPALIGDVFPNKDSSTWLFLPTVRYLSVA